ncbi:MAG: YbaY family lipoprotein, partial [Chloroflexi bacterium]|nr:YbaY family lipoprotein [Chloroflexota bacterium]
MNRLMTMLLLASMLVACGAPAATQPVGSSESSPLAAATSTVPASSTTAATAAPPSQATLVPTTVTAPTLVVPAPAASPTVAASPAVSTQQTSTAASDQTSIPGIVTIDAQRPIPPDAVLSVQLRQVNRDGIAFFTIVDEQQIPVQEPKPVSFVLTYTADDLVQPPAVMMPYAYEIHAQLNAPGRIPWFTNTPVDLQQLPSPFSITVAPRDSVAEVTGTITIPEQPALPPDAVLTMRLTRERGYVGFEDVPEIVTSALKPGKVPFILEYGTGAPTPETLLLHAEVRSGAKLLL